MKEADCQYQYLAGTDWVAADADVEPVQAGKVCNGALRRRKVYGEAVGVFDNCTHIVIRSFFSHPPPEGQTG